MSKELTRCIKLSSTLLSQNLYDLSNEDGLKLAFKLGAICTNALEVVLQSRTFLQPLKRQR